MNKTTEDTNKEITKLLNALKEVEVVNENVILGKIKGQLYEFERKMFNLTSTIDVCIITDELNYETTSLFQNVGDVTEELLKAFNKAKKTSLKS